MQPFRIVFLTLAQPLFLDCSTAAAPAAKMGCTSSKQGATPAERQASSPAVAPGVAEAVDKVAASRADAENRPVGVAAVPADVPNAAEAAAVLAADARDAAAAAATEGTPDATAAKTDDKKQLSVELTGPPPLKSPPPPPAPKPSLPAGAADPGAAAGGDVTPAAAVEAAEPAVAAAEPAGAEKPADA